MSAVTIPRCENPNNEYPSNDMKVYLMVRLQSWSFWECHYSEIPSDPLVLHSHIHEYGHVRNGLNGHRMLIMIEYIMNIGIPELENT